MLLKSTSLNFFLINGWLSRVMVLVVEVSIGEVRRRRGRGGIRERGARRNTGPPQEAKESYCCFSHLHLSYHVYYDGHLENKHYHDRDGREGWG